MKHKFHFKSSAGACYLNLQINRWHLWMNEQYRLANNLQISTLRSLVNFSAIILVHICRFLLDIYCVPIDWCFVSFSMECVVKIYELYFLTWALLWCHNGCQRITMDAAVAMACHSACKLSQIPSHFQNLNIFTCIWFVSSWFNWNL